MCFAVDELVNEFLHCMRLGGERVSGILVVLELVFFGAGCVVGEGRGKCQGKPFERCFGGGVLG